jgi:hypothetical protein
VGATIPFSSFFYTGAREAECRLFSSIDTQRRRQAGNSGKTSLRLLWASMGAGEQWERLVKKNGTTTLFNTNIFGIQGK